ncbi:MAG TPA: C25 family cysteine peptidase, partial [Candidatus Cloacimonadota bacterium]|nr:C25 family cysteine peptidase [Candidatus Cloacimonadota bacterium]
MKKLMLIAMLLVAMSFIWAAQSIPVSTSGTGLTLTNNTSNGFNIHYTVGSLQTLEVNTSLGVFDELSINDYASTNQVGLPKLPLLRKLISVPVGAQVHVEILDKTEKTVSLSDYQIQYPLMPFQPSLSKSQRPEDVPFAYNAASYSVDRYTQEQPFSVTELGYMRGVRMFALDFVPVQYNPVTKMLKIISDVNIRVNFTGADMAATEALQARTASVAFESLYKKTLLNYSGDERSTLNRYPLGYLILTPATFQSTLQPFIEMKTRQGYHVSVAIVGTGTGTIGNTTTAIKAYLQNIWDTATTANPAPTYCLLVGDTPQIPAWVGTTSTEHVTDDLYFRLQGTDFMPEMYFGRFSATTVAELQPQVDKSLQFEQFQMPDPSYLSEVVMMAGVDNTYGPTHANGQINYGTNNYYNAAHGITSHTYLYPTSGSSETQIQANLSSGCSYANYTAHGDVDQWYDPYMSIANINSLTNTNKYFVAVGNCCLTNHFDTATCFGEAMLRAANKAAVAYVGGTNSTYWNEDYWWAVGNKPVLGSGTPWITGHPGVYDLLFHEHSEAFEDWVYTMGSMVFSGNLAVVQANSTLINYYWEIYSIMGDPALQPYMGLPAVNTVSLPSVMFLGTNTVQISAEPYSYVAVSMNNVLHGAGLVDQTGVINLTIDPFTEPGNATIYITRSNRRPLIQTLQVIPLAGPYITVGNYTISDGNNHQADAGETFNINMTLNNVGSQDANGLVSVLSTEDAYAVLNTTTTSPVNIAANGTTTLTAAFNISVSHSTPDQHIVPLTVTFTDASENTWTAHMNLTVNAPNLQMGTPTITEVNGNGNGVYDPGETVNYVLPITNTGHSNVGAIHAVIVSNNPLLTITNGVIDIPSGLGVNQSSNLTCSIAINPEATVGALLPLGISLQAGNINIASTSYLQVGLIGDGFESGNTTTLPWTMSGSANWTVISGSTNAHTGNYCVKSGTIGNSQTTAIQVTMNIATAGNVSFWKKVSSESGYDKLFFYIDGTEKENWSGTVAWNQSTYPVTQGTHVFKWAYTKDNSQVAGSDCAWLDDVAFPASGTVNAPMFYSSVSSIDFGSVHIDSTATRTFMIQNLGTQQLTGTLSCPSYYTISSGDQNVSNISIAAGASQQFSISITPLAAETLNDNLTIQTNDPYAPSINIGLTCVAGPTGTDDHTQLPIATELKG